jgi:hypothetical protein
MDDPEPRSYPSLRILAGAGLLLPSPALLAAADTGLAADPSSSDVILLLTYVLLALLFSFMCSVAEAVLLSITPSFIAGLESTDPKRATLLKKLKVDDMQHLARQLWVKRARALGLEVDAANDAPTAAPPAGADSRGR